MLDEAMNMANLVNWEYDVIADQFTFDNRFYAMYRTTAELEGGYHMSSARYSKEFVYPTEIEFVAQEVEKAISATDPDFVFQREHRIIRRDGEIRYITVRFGITKDAEGRTIKTHGVKPGHYGSEEGRVGPPAGKPPAQSPLQYHQARYSEYGYCHSDVPRKNGDGLFR